MRRTLLAAVVCIAGVVAGCGSGPKSPTTSGPNSAASKSTTRTSTPVSAAIASLAQGPLTMGPPPPGTRYNAVNHLFLQRLATFLGHELEARALHNVDVTCTASVAARATCRASGTSAQGESSSHTVSVTINRTTGQLGFDTG